jgi:tetratricopeptide (TPR) repeat protein
MADMIDAGSFDLASELNEADFYLSKSMFEEAREVLERAHHFMPYHKLVREALSHFTEVTGEPIGNPPPDADDDEDETEEPTEEPAAIAAPEPPPERAAPTPAANPAPAPAPAPVPVPTAVETAAPGNPVSDIDVEEELYDASFYIDQAMFKEALLSIKKIMKIDSKHPEALQLLGEIKKRLKK